MVGDRDGEILARLDAMKRDEEVVRQRSHDILSTLTAIKLGVEGLVDRPTVVSGWSQPVTAREVSIAIASIVGTIGVLKFLGKV